MTRGHYSLLLAWLALSACFGAVTPSSSSTSSDLLGIVTVKELLGNDTTTSSGNRSSLIDVLSREPTSPGASAAGDALSEDDDCVYNEMEHLPEKMLLVGIVGTLSAIVGIALNCLASFLLGRMMLATSPALIYLFTLAMLDVLFLVCYLLVFSVQIYFDYFKSPTLYYAWNWYLMLVFPVAKIVQTASTYMIVLASIERLIDVVGATGPLSQCTRQKRIIVVVSVCVTSFVFRAGAFWELVIDEKPECPEGFERLEVSRSEIAKTKEFQIYNVYVISMVQVIIPFVLLLLLNIIITWRIRKALRSGDQQIFRRKSAWEGRDQSEHAKTATKMLIAIVCSYLISNCLSVFVTAMEQINVQFLLDHYKFFTLAVDMINLLYVITASTRLLIYIAANVKIRQQFFDIICCHSINFRSRSVTKNSTTTSAAFLPPSSNGQLSHHPIPSRSSTSRELGNGERELLTCRGGEDMSDSNTPVFVRHYFTPRNSDKCAKAPLARERESEFNLSNCSTPMIDSANSVTTPGTECTNLTPYIVNGRLLPYPGFGTVEEESTSL